MSTGLIVSCIWNNYTYRGYQFILSGNTFSMFGVFFCDMFLSLFVHWNIPLVCAGITCLLIKHLVCVSRLTKARCSFHFNLQFHWKLHTAHDVHPEFSLPNMPFNFARSTVLSNIDLSWFHCGHSKLTVIIFYV